MFSLVLKDTNYTDKLLLLTSQYKKALKEIESLNEIASKTGLEHGQIKKTRQKSHSTDHFTIESEKVEKELIIPLTV